MEGILYKLRCIPFFMSVILLLQGCEEALNKKSSREQQETTLNLSMKVGGETSILEIERLSLSSEKMVTSKFNQERTLEYKEFIEESNKFLQEIEDETTKENFSFREIEENEAELRRLKKWLVKIKKRDYFLCETNKEASDLFEKCNKVLEEFTEKVYLCEGWTCTP